MQLVKCSISPVLNTLSLLTMAMAFGSTSPSHSVTPSFSLQQHNCLQPRASPLHSVCLSPSLQIETSKCIPRAQADEFSGASSDSVVVAATPGMESKGSVVGRRSSPLQRGGTLTGDKASRKDPGLAALGKSGAKCAISDGPFHDSRWKKGTWNLEQFTSDGKVNWDAVVDAEVIRRKWLEDNPEASLNEDPVVFGTSTIPWWVWVRRFHLPEAELLNGRAAMVGFFSGHVVDSLTGFGLVDQTSSFLGKFLIFVSVLGVLLIRKNEDVENLKQLAQEWSFYDKQWQATWQEDQVSTSKRD